MLLVQNNSRKGQFAFILIVLIVFLLSAMVGIIDIKDKGRFWLFHNIRMGIFNSELKRNWGISGTLIIMVSIFIYFTLFFLVLVGLHFCIDFFIKCDSGINFQFKLLNTKLGTFLHKYRLGYVVNIAFLGDVFQFLFLVGFYLRCLAITKEGAYFDSKLYVIIACKILLCYVPIILLLLYIKLISYSIKDHGIKYLRNRKIALVLHQSKMPKSSSCKPPHKRLHTEWFVIDELEMEHLRCLKDIIEISLVIVDIEQTNNQTKIEELIEKYKEYFVEPHIISLLYLDSVSNYDFKRLGIDENCFDFYYDINYISLNMKKSINMEDVLQSIMIPIYHQEIVSLLNILPPEVERYYNKLHFAPSYFYSYYRKILNKFTLRQAVYAFFDIIDFVIRLNVLALLDSTENNKDILSTVGDFSKMQKILSQYGSIDLKQPLDLSFFSQEMKQILWNKLQINSIDITNLESLLRMIGHMRNITKAHGFVKECELQSMYHLMFCVSLYVFYKFDICSMSIFIDCYTKKLVLKDKSRIIDTFGKYAFWESNQLFITTKKEGEFINMITGEIKIEKGK